MKYNKIHYKTIIKNKKIYIFAVLKVIVQPKCKIMSSFTQAVVVPICINFFLLLNTVTR